MSINALQPITHPRALNNSTAVANRKRGRTQQRNPSENSPTDNFRVSCS